MVLTSQPARVPLARDWSCGYPHMEIMGDTAFVIYSVSKEDVAVCRFSLSELD